MLGDDDYRAPGDEHVVNLIPGHRPGFVHPEKRPDESAAYGKRDSRLRCFELD
ncbi:MAG: hypothetical protein ACP5H2_11090 [Solirubrobacteraceae bacterium]